MIRSAIALPLLIACSQDADIGIDTTPLTCTDVGFAEVSGSVRNPADGQNYEFGAVSPRVALSGSTDGTPYAVILQGTDVGLQLRLGFDCGAAERTSYGVVPVTPQRIDCPFQVTGVIGGRIEFLEAQSGTLVVDENSNCLAGRFRIDFGDDGEIAGGFSSAWQ